MSKSRSGSGRLAISIDQVSGAVTIADPRRSRVNEARSVIVGGLTARAFPRTVEEDPLFTDEERRSIAERGFPIGAHGALLAEEDPYLFYIACTRASEELLLTYAKLDASGASQEPSPYLTEVALCPAKYPRTKTSGAFQLMQISFDAKLGIVSA